MFLCGVCVFYDLFHIPFVFVTHLWIRGMCICMCTYVCVAELPLCYTGYSSWGSINIVDVSGHERVWTTFQSELISIPVTNMAIAVACKQFTQPTFSASTSNGGIGARIIGHKNTKPQSTLQDKTLNYGDRSVSGIALCFGGKDVFYISLNQGMMFSTVVPYCSYG